MTSSIITLTTDFGSDSPYVAQMKGVILGIDPTATLIDVTHDIAPQDIRQAALVLEDVTPQFPSGTIHVCVVDPGVGSNRRILLVQANQQRFIAPDNGVLSRVLSDDLPADVVSLTCSDYWRQPVSNTFHGRDIMAPVAAHLSRGTPATALGDPTDQWIRLDWPSPVVKGARVRGAVICVDTFGNLITNIERHHLAGLDDLQKTTIDIAGTTVRGIVDTYANRPVGTTVALIGSSGRLEVAMVNGNAAQKLGAGVEEEVVVRAENWSRGELE